jgi:hypothetical protein
MKILKILALPAILIYCCSAFGQWNPNPLENNTVCDVVEMKFNLKMVSDGNNGALLFWSDRRDLPDLGNIYGQHLGADGNILWEEEARPFCLAVRIQDQPHCISDGQGGAFLVWRDARSSVTSTNIWEYYAQHVNSNGIASWQANGIAVNGNQPSTGVSGSFDHSTLICSDGSGGIIVSWTQNSTLNNTHDCFAQRIDINGNLMWNGGNPLPIRVGATYPQSLQVLSDGAGGAYILHTDTDGGFTNGIRAHRVNSEGVLLWGENGMEPAWGITLGQFHATLATNGELFIAWQQTPSPHAIKAQLVNPSGQNLWSEGGVDVVTTGNLLEQPRVAADEFGLYVTFLRTDIYKVAHAQKLTYQGQLFWGESAVPTTSSQASHQFHNITPDGLGGAVVYFLVNSVTGPGGDPATLLARNVKSDGSFNGDVVLINNSVPVSGAGKSDINAIPLSNNDYLISWIENRAPNPSAARQVYASKFFFTPYDNTNVSSYNELYIVNIYPNPAKTHFRIDNLGLDVTDISVFDNSGRLIFNEKLAQDYLNVNTLSWNAGIYVIKIESGKDTQFRKLVVY